MRTHFEFSSPDFPSYPGEEEEINPGRFGRRLAEFFAKELPSRGFAVLSISPEDWGIAVEIENEEFPLWIGCGNYEEFENGFNCFIQPCKPFVRKWFRKIPTQATVERLANALEDILQTSGNVSNFRWWTEIGM